MLRAVPATMLIAALKACCVEVGHFELSNFFNLCFGDVRNLGLVGHTGTALDSASLLDENGCGRGLGDEGERTILVNRDDNGNDETRLL